MSVDSEELWKYVCRIVDKVPHQVYISLAVILCVGFVSFIVWKGLSKGARYTVLLALAEYIGLIYCSTFFFRKAMKVSKYDWHPFWSYQAIAAGNGKLIPEIIMNVLLFVPIGLLLGMVFKNLKWWMIVLIGVLISSSIEILQFIYVKGFSEVDDVIHNTAGCLLGSELIHLVRLVYNKVTIIVNNRLCH